MLLYIHMKFRFSQITFIFAILFFIAPTNVGATLDCEFIDDRETAPTVPCVHDGILYDASVQWGPNDTVGYEYNTWWKSDECTVTFDDVKPLTINCLPSGHALDRNWASGTWYPSVGYYNGNGFGAAWGIWNIPYESPFQLSYYFGLINEDWTEEDVGCDTNAKEYCGFATSSYAFVIQGNATSSVNAWKYEYQMYDVDGVVIEPQGAYGKSTTYPYAQSIARSDPLIFPTQDKKVYLLNVCVGYQYDFPLAFGFAGTESICKSQFIGNGYTDEELGNLLFQLGKITSTSTVVTGEPDVIDVWNQNECSDIGITEVFKGVKCALIWAFSPSQESLQKFNQAKTSVLTLYPIGYATLILSDVNTAFTSTSTTAFDKDIDVKKFFGQTGGTTTISVSNLTSELGMVEPIINYGEIVLWTLFVGWLLVWGLTRKL